MGIIIPIFENIFESALGICADLHPALTPFSFEVAIQLLEAKLQLLPDPRASILSFIYLLKTHHEPEAVPDARC